MSDPTPSLPTILAARRRIEGSVHRTPLLSSRTLSARVGREVFLKAEHLQKTGSFKVRGALNFMLGMDTEARARGVVTVSAGNHAQAVAWAAGEVGISATVVMPAGASKAKAAASRGYGAHVRMEGDVFQAFQLALDIAEAEGRTFVHPFDAEAVLAGQATVALEILEDLPEVGTVVVPVGGGGLIGGVTAGLVGAGSSAAIYGVEPEGAPGMRRSLEKGEPIRLKQVRTVADGLGAPMAGEMPFRLVRDHARGIVLVTDDEIVEALSFLLRFTKQLAEPAGAAGVAALLSGRIEPSADPVVVVVSGGNVGPEALAELLTP